MKILPTIGYESVTIPENHADDWSRYYGGFVEKARQKSTPQPVTIARPNIQMVEESKQVVPTPVQIAEVSVQRVEQRRGPVPAKPKFEF